MSHPFTYEIDERNLRIQLRSAEIPLKEEAWKKFESYCETQKTPDAKSKFKGFELSVNRNIMLPAVFGLIIIVFSFLLFNFISINNNRVEKTTNTVEVTVPKLEVNNMAVANAQQKNASERPIQNKPPINNSELPINVIHSNQNNQVSSNANIESTTLETKSTTPSVVSELTSENPVAAIDTAKEETFQKQKRRKKREEETLSSIKPTLITDEEDASVIPNLSE